MLYLALKSLHIISIVTWFAGLFYLGRLFVYHKEGEQKSQQEYQVLHSQFCLMERRLWNAITQPSMYIALICGSALTWITQSFTTRWLLIKILLVTILIGYHFFCDKIRLDLESGNCSWTGKSLRMFNEIPSVLLIGIVLVVVFKEMLTWQVLLGALALFTSLIAVSVLLLARKRQRKP